MIVESDQSLRSGLVLSTEQIIEPRPATTVGHVDQIDAGHHLEQLAGNMASTPNAARRHIDLARIGLGVRDELGNRLGWNRWMDRHDKRLADDGCDRCDVADEIEIEFVI